ncbi:MCE family protein [Nocardia rhizosphaerihabitans]|uniref:ABC transporter substrate-binding protein n=1 Tax=Nocardia rhizosphaerihabitans TaxID=1691570 RepID=A0ABQ2L382_9NOCA|nr:MCE family protein [Nocardia rhizosphaerihabitans]GGO01066.1 ABC transporter substrate-binding protein [Nocardia rhizosphaerihabitans]
MNSFAERDPLRMGLMGIGIIAALLVGLFNYENIPGWPGSTTITAEFADASGLNTGDAVQISGIEVGKVDRIELSDDHVDIALRVDTDGQRLGTRTTAAIKVETALGRRYVELRPDGEGSIGDRIPVDHTTSGFDITESLNQLTSRLAGTDKAQLADALDSVSTVLDTLPDNLRPSLDGVSRLSNTIASRDAALLDLLDRAESVTGVLAERNQNLTQLVTDGGSLFAALNDRATMIRNLLVNVRALSAELHGLAQENRQTLAPMLAELDQVLSLLNANYDNINTAISGMRPFVTQLGESVGSGPFFGVLLHNIAPANLNGQQPGSPGGGR